MVEQLVPHRIVSIYHLLFDYVFSLLVPLNWKILLVNCKIALVACQLINDLLFQSCF